MLGFVLTKLLTHPGVAFTLMWKEVWTLLADWLQASHPLFLCPVFLPKMRKLLRQNTEWRKCQIILEVCFSWLANMKALILSGILQNRGKCDFCIHSWKLLFIKGMLEVHYPFRLLFTHNLLGLLTIFQPLKLTLDFLQFVRVLIMFVSRCLKQLSWQQQPLINNT